VEVIVFFISDIKLPITMFCPGCGKESRGICLSCLLKRRPIKLNTYPSIKYCQCGLFKVHDRWEKEIIPHLKKQIEKSLIYPEKVKVKDIEILLKESEEKPEKIKAYVTVAYEGESKKLPLEVKIKWEKISCPQCSRLSGGYYEAVLQNRTGRNITSLINPEFISKVEEVRGGVNYYITSMEYAQEVVNTLIEQGVVVKKSWSGGGVRNGKRVYRTYFSLKSPPLAKGDVVKFRGNIYLIKKIGKRSNCIRLSGGGYRREKFIPMQKLLESNEVIKVKEQRYGTVSRVYEDELEVISEGRKLKIEACGRRVREGERITFVKFGGKYYLVGVDDKSK